MFRHADKVVLFDASVELLLLPQKKWNF